MTLSSPRGPRELRIMLVKNPAGANEVLRTLALEPGEHDLLGVLNDQIADGRDVSWIWDADFELLADRVAGVICSGNRAADLAARFKYAGRRAVADPRDPGSAGGARGGHRQGDSNAPSTRCPPTRRCWRCASCCRAAARREQVVVSALPRCRVVVWHDLECGGYRADLPLWRELAAAAAGRDGHASVLDIGAGTGRVALDLAALGHRVTALDLDAALLEALRERAAGLPVETVQADARDFSLARTDFDLCLVPMQTLQLLRGAAERAALFEHARAHLRANALLACAIVDEVDRFDSRDGALGPTPERVVIGSTLYVSRAVRVERRDGADQDRARAPRAAPG